MALSGKLHAHTKERADSGCLNLHTHTYIHTNDGGLQLGVPLVGWDDGTATSHLCVRTFVCVHVC